MYGEYAKKFLSPENPLFSLVLIKTGQVREVFKTPNITEQLSKNWKVHIAYLLKNIHNV